jgi:protein-tyrosine-phosphatase/DNA-binding HxlR family transcriptional regulator
MAGERDRRAAALAALGEPTRLGIVDHLHEQDLSPDSLAEALGVPGNLLAHHLNVLTAAGIVERVPSQGDRRRTYVRLVDTALAGLLPPAPVIVAPRVVFVCTHNSARSVLAEALWAHASDVPAASAGTEPADRINPRARAVARRFRLPLPADRPRHVDEVLRPDDLVVSVCDAVNEHAALTGHVRLHWSVPDPSAAGTDAAFARAVDDLRDRVHRLAPRVQSGRPRSTRRSPTTRRSTP